MYAVVTTGGKQYRVEPGSELEVERLSGDAGSSVTFDRVLLVGDGEAVTIGTPTVEGATVSGTVLGEALGPKLIVFKFKQKATYRRKNGHRQHLTRVRIDEINASGKKAKADKADEADKPEKAEKAQKADKAPKAEAAAQSTDSADAAEAPAPEKPKRTRKAAEKPASAETEKPKRTRKAATKKSAEE
ncbi:MAG TPA: 50S ribosomal protein L21 [Candidatus Limnocylindria bacterium]|nr:50S ribosomal protein L21 [Candidatus Limnocylindria bacterium]